LITVVSLIFNLSKLWCFVRINLEKRIWMADANIISSLYISVLTHDVIDEALWKQILTTCTSNKTRTAEIANSIIEKLSQQFQQQNNQKITSTFSVTQFSVLCQYLWRFHNYLGVSLKREVWYDFILEKSLSTLDTEAQSNISRLCSSLAAKDVQFSEMLFDAYEIQCNMNAQSSQQLMFVSIAFLLTIQIISAIISFFKALSKNIFRTNCYIYPNR
jgi:hypothetical protein